MREYGYLQAIRPSATNKVAEAIGQAAARLAEQLHAGAIISLTDCGFTARLISKHRPESIIFAVASDRGAARRLALSWGVIPFLCNLEASPTDEVVAEFCCKRALESGYLDSGDIVIVTHGARPDMGGD